MKKIAALYFSLLISFYGTTQAIQHNPAILMDSVIKKATEAYMNDSSRIGISVGVYKDNKIFTYNYGYTDNSNKHLVNSFTIYEIGSITKTFTGTLLAKAVSDKKVKIDDDIRKYMNGKYPNLEYQGHPIKLFQLVNHMSGLPFFLPDKPEIFRNANFDSLPFTIRDIQQQYSTRNFFNDLHKVKLDTVPGFNFHYSNVGAQLLGHILEKIYKMPYDELLKKYILGPLGMKSTSARLQGNRIDNVSIGYDNKGNLMPYNPKQLEAAGGIYSCVNDMLKYLKFHLKETNQIIALSHKPTWGNVNNFAIGLNWQEKMMLGQYRKIWQSGGTFGFSSYCVIYPELNIGIVLLTNEADQTAQGGLEEVANKIFEAIKNK